MPPLTTLDVIALVAHTLFTALAFGTMVRDKVAAMMGRWRTPEFRLLALNLTPGGGLGVLLAMLLVSHKTRKMLFWQSSVPSTFAWINGLRLVLSEDAKSWVVGLLFDAVVSAFHFKHLVAGVVLAAAVVFLGQSQGWIPKKKRTRRPSGLFYLIFVPPPVVQRFAELVLPMTVSSFAIDVIWQRAFI